MDISCEKLIKVPTLSTTPSEAGAQKVFNHWERMMKLFLTAAQDTSVMFGSPPPNKYAIMVGYLSPEVFAYVEEVEDYDRAMALLHAVYSKKKNVLSARYKLNSRAQHPSESLLEFVQSLFALSNDCNFESVAAERHREEAIRGALIAGLHSTKIREEVLKHDDLSLAKVIDLCQSSELTERTCQLMGRPISEAVTRNSILPQPTMASNCAIDPVSDNLAVRDASFADHARAENYETSDSELNISQVNNLEANGMENSQLLAQTEVLVKSETSPPALEPVSYPDHSMIMQGEIENSNVLREPRSLRYPCLECGKGFPTSTRLREHTRIHTGEKPHTCERCGKSFNRKSNLKVHLYIHDGIRPHVCPECGKAFSHMSNWKKHVMIHSRTKPHAWRHREEDRQRTKTHSAGSALLTCRLCNLSFSRPNALKAHINSHKTQGSPPAELSVENSGLLLSNQPQTSAMIWGGNGLDLQSNVSTARVSMVYDALGGRYDGKS